MKLYKKVDAASKPDPAQTRLVQELKHTSPLIGCRIDPTGRFVFAGAQDGTVQRWELATGKRTEFIGHKSWVRGLAFHPTVHRLYAGDYAGHVLVWTTDEDAPKLVQVIEAHDGWVRAVAVSPDGRLLASCGNDHLVKLWSATGGKPVAELAGHDCHVYNVAFHPDGKHLVSADLKGVLKQWDAETAAPVRDLDARVLHKYDTSFRADIGGIRGIAFNAAGTLLACSGITEVTNAFAGVGKPLTILFDWKTGKQKQQLVPKENFQGTGWGVAFHPHGFVVGVGGGSGGVLWFWKPEQSQAFFTLKLPNNARDVSLHPDSERLAVAFFDGAVRIYRMTAKTPAKG